MSDYESQILGMVITRPEKIHEIELRPEEFGDPSAKQIFSAMLAVSKEGLEPDIINLADNLNESTGEDWLRSLSALATQCVMSEGNLPAYLRIVKDAYQQRVVETSAAKYYEDVRRGEKGALANLITSVSGMHVNNHWTGQRALSRVIQNLDDIQSGKSKPGIPTGISRIDKLFGGLKDTRLIIIAARPAIGKTSVMLNWALNANANVGIISAEQPADELMQRMIGISGGVQIENLQSGRLSDDDLQRVLKSTADLEKRTISIYDKANPKLGDVTQAALQMKYRDKIDVLYVDYIQRIYGKGDTRALEVGSVSAALKGLARQLEIPVVALSQLNREVENRTSKRPQLADLKESGDIEQDADMVYMLYRDAYYNDVADNQMEISLKKNRHGRTGLVMARWEPEYVRLSNP